MCKVNIKGAGGMAPCRQCEEWRNVVERNERSMQESAVCLGKLIKQCSDRANEIQQMRGQLDASKKALKDRDTKLTEAQQTVASSQALIEEASREAKELCEACGTKRIDQDMYSVNDIKAMFDANLKVVKKGSQDLIALKETKRKLKQEKQALEEKLAKAQSDLENAKVAEERAQGYIGYLLDTARKTAVTHALLLGKAQGDIDNSPVEAVCDMLGECVRRFNDQAEMIKDLKERIGGLIDEKNKLIAKAGLPEDFDDEETDDDVSFRNSRRSSRVIDGDEVGPDGDLNELVVDIEVVMAAAKKVFEQGGRSFGDFTYNGFKDFARGFFDAKLFGLVPTGEAKHSASKEGQLRFKRDSIELDIGLLQNTAQAISQAVAKHSDGAVRQFCETINNAVGLIETLSDDDKIVRWVMLSSLLDYVSATFSREGIFNRISAHKINDLCKDGEPEDTVFQAIKSLYEAGFILYAPHTRQTMVKSSRR